MLNDACCWSRPPQVGFEPGSAAHGADTTAVWRGGAPGPDFSRERAMSDSIYLYTCVAMLIPYVPVAHATHCSVYVSVGSDSLTGSPARRAAPWLARAQLP